jgi:uncharacterized membrane protein
VKEWLNLITEPVATAIDALALLVIVIATLQVLVKLARAVFKPLPDLVAREAWLRYARWLVAALTLQLAADIIETSTSASWQAIGRLGATALIRTFLNYFLERDVEQQQRVCDAETPPGATQSPSEASR